jgi:hypothetical protein
MKSGNPAAHVCWIAMLATIPVPHFRQLGCGHPVVSCCIPQSEQVLK